MRCCFCNKINQVGNFVILEKNEKKHLFRTLKTPIDAKIMLINGKGKKAISIVRDSQELEIISIEECKEPQPKIHLFVSPPKKKSMDIILKQASQIGITSITPILTKYSIAKYDNKSQDRMESLVIEGCKQSNNPFFPQINPMIKLSDSINFIKENNYKSFFGSLNNTNKSERCCEICNIAWFIGPEGGFSDEEIDIMIQNNIQPLNIGNHILRVETAAITGATILQYLNT